ncbi:MAG: hypothetical protein IT209_07285 [Armatimonadetes bacterium]|nr:hypothetical protein [Armatimonadota bacterium]
MAGQAVTEQAAKARAGLEPEAQGPDARVAGQALGRAAERELVRPRLPAEPPARLAPQPPEI